MLFDSVSVELSNRQNRLCQALADLIKNDNEIYIITGEEIERRLIRKVNTNKFDECKALAYFPKILHFHKDYIIQRFNNDPILMMDFEKIDEKTFSRRLRNQLYCLLVNDFAIKHGVEF